MLDDNLVVILSAAKDPRDPSVFALRMTSCVSL